MVYDVNTTTQDGFVFNVRKGESMLMEIINARNPKLSGRSADDVLLECRADLLDVWGEAMAPVYIEITYELQMLLQ